MRFQEKPIASIRHSNVSELSGMALAERDDEFWGHNDRGNRKKIFRFNTEGNVLQFVKLKGIKSDDWESMADDHTGHMYLADTGDNKFKRDDYRIYKIAKPACHTSKIDGICTAKLKYEDGKSHDVEAMFWMNHSLYLITKTSKKRNKKGDRPLVFRIDDFDSDTKRTVEKLGELPFQGRITEADYSSSLDMVVILFKTMNGKSGRNGLVFFRDVQKQDGNLHSIEPESIALFPERKRYDSTEAIVFQSDRLIMTNEKGRIWKFPVHAYCSI